MPHERAYVWAVAGALLLVLPLTYIVGYCLLSDPTVVVYKTDNGLAVFHRETYYQPGEYFDALETLFWPAHWLDTQVRPAFWQGQELTQAEFEAWMRAEETIYEIPPPP